MKTTYPVTFAVDFPDRALNRLTTAFRLIVAIPIVIILSLVCSESKSKLPSCVADHPTATRRSGRPTSPMNKVSPVSTAYGWVSLALRS